MVSSGPVGVVKPGASPATLVTLVRRRYRSVPIDRRLRCPYVGATTPGAQVTRP